MPIIDFLAFGREHTTSGPSSDFQVEVDWDDIVVLIDIFAKRGNIDARCLSAVLDVLAEYSNQQRQKPVVTSDDEGA